MVRKAEVVEEPVKRTRRSTAEVAAARKAKEAPAAPTARRSKKAAAEEAPAPTVTKKRATSKPEVVEVKATRRSKKSTEDVEIEISHEPKAKAMFNPLSAIDDELDNIEKSYGLTGSSLGSSEDRQHTGLLELDLILGKGIQPGWYTFFGAEQSCKSTGASTWMVAALNSNVPVIQYWDYEGCFSLSCKLKTSIGEVTGRELLKHFGIPEVLDTEKTYIDVVGLEVETLGQMVKVDRLYYSGVKPETRLVTESGREFNGYAHPMMCVDDEGNLVYRTLEHLKPGDKVVVRTDPSI